MNRRIQATYASSVRGLRWRLRASRRTWSSNRGFGSRIGPGGGSLTPGSSILLLPSGARKLWGPIDCGEYTPFVKTRQAGYRYASGRNEATRQQRAEAAVGALDSRASFGRA